MWTVLLDYLTGTAQARPTLEASRRRFLLNSRRRGASPRSPSPPAAGSWAARAGPSRPPAALLRLPVTEGRRTRRGRDRCPARPGRRGGCPTASFYRIDTALVVPAVDPDDWRLRIHGLVDREIEIELRTTWSKRRLTEDWVTICCVSNPVGGDLIGNAWWSGVRIADLLEEAGVQAGADAVKQTSQDGWTCGTPIEALTDDRNAMLAVAMNGRPLPVDHGFPVRMIVPGLYGYVSATKWVVDLEVTRFADFSAYWTDRGWSSKGPVKTAVARRGAPRRERRRRPAPVRVGGHAWAQHTGIEKVEYRLDGDAWREAELGRVPGNDTWVQWAGSVDVRGGQPHARGAGHRPERLHADRGARRRGARRRHRLAPACPSRRLGPHQFGSAGSVGGGRGTSSGCTT